ncbi:hypothetical protein D3C81_1221020 [compost metagenome]
MLDVAAFAVDPLEHHARHPRAHLRGTRGENAPAEFRADGQGLELQGFYPDLGYGGLGVLLFGVVAPGNGQGQKRHERHGAQAMDKDDRHTDLPMMTGRMLRQAGHGCLLIPVGRV